MFTGIVETVGTIARVERRGELKVLTVHCPEVLDDVHLGDSIALNGACQTVVRFDDTTFDVEAGPETLRLTTLDSWRSGHRVNVERSLQIGARLGGHWVLGHVDGVTTLLERRDGTETTELRFRLLPDLAPQIARKGSITIDGISLTVTDVTADSFGLAIIPFTLQHTTLNERRVGDPINIETDVLAKYVARLHEGAAAGGGLDMSLLAQAGFLGGRQ